MVAVEYRVITVLTLSHDRFIYISCSKYSYFTDWYTVFGVRLFAVISYDRYKLHIEKGWEHRKTHTTYHYTATNIFVLFNDAVMLRLYSVGDRRVDEYGALMERY
jgi:hypothetical protein